MKQRENAGKDNNIAAFFRCRIMMVGQICPEQTYPKPQTPWQQQAQKFQASQHLHGLGPKVSKLH